MVRVGPDTIKLSTFAYSGNIDWAKLKSNTEKTWKRGPFQLFRFPMFNIIYCSISNTISFVTSPPAILSGKGNNNYEVLNKLGFQYALEQIESEIRRIGIYIPIESFKVSRLDLFINLNLTKSFKRIIKKLGKVKIPHMDYFEFRGHNMPSIYWGWGNRSRKVIVYDKAREMRDKKIGSKSYYRRHGIRTERTIRIELRYYNSQSLQRHTGIRTVADLIANYDELSCIGNNNVIFSKFEFLLLFSRKECIKAYSVLNRMAILKVIVFVDRDINIIYFKTPRSRGPPLREGKRQENNEV